MSISGTILYNSGFSELSDIFVIPVRLDNCEIPYERFRSIQYVDLFPSWNDGLQKILKITGITYSQYIENIRFVVTQQIQIGRRIARVKNQVHALLEMNMNLTYNVTIIIFHTPLYCFKHRLWRIELFRSQHHYAVKL